MNIYIIEKMNTASPFNILVLCRISTKNANFETDRLECRLEY